ncbi:L-seryl-tRNA(Sec) selenium transferase [Azospirillum halopraeferens]|uniref:L-seryl-tRNA(Sec) selenium transferase n=1 Tax=Azospirillum halopraeferens TaxID=34010 RepID=UPI000A06BA9B|nr:L-seryl-tRNA(Sec) selenium transferase [Azospirillum halopraeferens]
MSLAPPPARPPARLPDARRRLPPVHKLLESPDAQALAAEHGRTALTAALRAALDTARAAAARGDGVPGVPALLADARERLAAARRPVLRPAINATGVVLHTNLGRAPLADAAVDAVAAVAGGYATLELDTATGRRGGRGDAVAALLCDLTGAEAALAVNNNAAAVLLAVSALAAGGEAVVSRGELVEIGGSFRIPDVVRQGGARLVEVGATNKTRLGDYEAAIGPDTRVLLKVHRSNFRMVGFTAAPATADLAALARRRGLALVEDLGSGTLVDLTAYGLPHEPTVGDAVAAGVDLVTFSGDKLLGGPQAGLVAGRRDAVARLKAHPLMRALRPDKMALAALEATLRLYREPDRLAERLPVLAMLAATPAMLEARAARLAGLLAGIGGLTVEPGQDEAYAGGGSLPGVTIPTRTLALRAASMGAAALAARLRTGRPAVVGRLSGDRLLLDLRTVAEAELPALAAAVREAVA